MTTGNSINIHAPTHDQHNICGYPRAKYVICSHSIQAVSKHTVFLLKRAHYHYKLFSSQISQQCQLAMMWNTCNDVLIHLIQDIFTRGTLNQLTSLNSQLAWELLPFYVKQSSSIMCSLNGLPKEAVSRCHQLLHYL